MSIKTLKIKIYLFIFILSLTGFFAHKTKSAQMLFLIPNQSEFSSRGSVDRIILLKIKPDSLDEVTDSDTVHVVADVTLPFDFSDSLEYKWTLGQNVELMSGQTTGKIENFKKDTAQSIQISVRGFNLLHNRHIGLEIWGLKNNRRLFAEGLISSQPEESFEKIVQFIEKQNIKKSGLKK